MSRSIDISETHKEIVQAILREHLTTSCHVWVFGSRATWLAKEYSDLDLAIARKDGTPLSLTVMSALETAFEDSLLPWKVDVIDLHGVSAEFRSAIERDKVLFSLGVGGWRKSRWGNEISLEYGKSLKGYRNGTGKFQVFGSNGPVGWTDTALTQGPGVVLGRKGAYRGVEFSKSSFYVIDTAYFIKLKSNLDMRWVYYSIKHHKLGEIDDGSPIPSTTRSAVYVCNLNVPELIEQKAIAHILGTLDDKIELNRQTNQTLEAMAQALFQSWFVDFDPVIDKALAAGNEIPEAFQAKAAARKALGDQRLALPEEVTALFPDAFVFTEEMGWIPEGWESKKLSALLEIKYGKDHKKLGEGDIPVYGSGGLMRNAEKSLYTGESVLIPRKGTLSNILYVNEAFWTVDTMFYTIPKHHNIAKYVFYHLKGLDFASMNVGSAVPSMTTKVLNELSVILPNDRVLKKFDDILKTYFKNLLANINQNSNLINIRDTLLPKLISGELRVADAEKFLGEISV